MNTKAFALQNVILLPALIILLLATMTVLQSPIEHFFDRIDDGSGSCTAKDTNAITDCITPVYPNILKLLIGTIPIIIILAFIVYALLTTRGGG